MGSLFMFGSSMIEVAVGLTFFYVLLALICSTINEWIVTLLKLRSNNLEKGIKTLLEDPASKDIAEVVYNHPLITGLARKGYKPSYISSKNFTRALLDVIKETDPEKVQDHSDDFRKSLKRMKDGKLKKSLLLLVEETGDDLIKARRNIETWYDESMERVSGWYKRKVRWVILGIALIVTISLNADTFFIANTLYRDADLRKDVVRFVDERTNDQVGDAADMSELLDEIDAMQLPIGWSKESITPKWEKQNISNQQENAPFSAYLKLWILKILGLLFTTFAASQGAPFWFDVLNKLNSLRGSGGRPKSGEEAPQKA
jgi:hypothetical protein